MIEMKRVWFLFWEPPCTTASLARRPPLRSPCLPYGLDPSDPQTREGNMHILQCLGLAARHHSLGGPSAGEQPAWGYFRYLPEWKELAAEGSEVIFDWCAYGRPWKKPTRLLLLGAPWLEPLGRRCSCPAFHIHLRVRGCVTARTASYSPEFGAEVARLLKESGEGP